jgi:hypothetical protein
VKSIAIFVIAAMLVTTLAMTTTTQQALADKVGPHPEENRVRQGGLGEYFSSDGREAYGGTKGPGHGDATSNFAKPGDQPGGHEQFGLDSLGENFGFYASGECHARTPPCE